MPSHIYDEGAKPSVPFHNGVAINKAQLAEHINRIKGEQKGRLYCYDNRVGGFKARFWFAADNRADAELIAQNILNIAGHPWEPTKLKQAKDASSWDCHVD
jgi:hypothetical protein